MDLTALLKSFIYLVSSALFVPVLLLLSLLFLWLLMYCGSFCSLWFLRKRLPPSPDPLQALRVLEFSVFPPHVQKVITKLLALKEEKARELAVMHLLRDCELQLWKSLDRLKMLIRIGPGLGLIGTLIPMGKGLAALSQGDLTRLSGDLVIAFTTTVVGLSLGLVSYFLFTVQRRWIEEDVKNMELAAEVLLGLEDDEQEQQ